MSDKVEVKNSIYAHKNNLRSLNEKQQNELDRVRLNHSKRKAQLANQQAQEIVNIRNNNQKELIEQAHRHEKVLEKLRDNLATVKDTAEKQKLDVAQNLEKNLSRAKLRFHERLAQEKATQEMVIEEMNQKANIEMERLQRQVEAKDSELKHNAKMEFESLKDKSQTELAMTKQTFQTKKYAAEDKYQRSLRVQAKEHSKTLANEERKFQKALKDRTDTYHKEFSALKTDSSNKKELAKSVFEKNFSKLIKNHEKSLADLSAKKAKIVQEMKNKILKAHSLDVSRSSDPFYSATTMDPQVKEIDGAYLISIPVRESDAGSVVINANKRNITLSMNRRFENKLEEEGSTEKVKRVETLTKSFDVEKIVDINQVEKTYQDGLLTFKIALA